MYPIKNHYGGQVQYSLRGRETEIEGIVLSIQNLFYAAPHSKSVAKLHVPTNVQPPQQMSGELALPLLTRNTHAQWASHQVVYASLTRLAQPCTRMSFLIMTDTYVHHENRSLFQSLALMCSAITNCILV